ncbi:insecticidal toxin complex protein TcaB1 [Pseudomonas fluorescens Q2-87]|uniref:Insecticidal toxin complex protein TcaB1 n=1 Tax=Pseudomonas fluorescens (strain Q2-87) TaxID=1038922 RepID=J2EXL3_PSEFQ|nr:neuraminidase-like domain-containing protein [Pseudomonas fluorescens]EJL01318.1 insecticidal toxin complex protein TcaB1 [Pseudomonas fluorescens Q2-87]
MTVAMKKQLDESLRDAQLALYLYKVAPNNPTTKNLKLKTAEALYEHWLLDVLVSQDVPTTPVACAIASLQQYIHRILMNLEPGYDSASLSVEHLKTWRNEMHQYPIWAAHQKLLYFPGAYLDPQLRSNKSDNFRQLENDLNQNQIQPDAVQSAVMAYLTRFEEIANLNILNGYIDGADLANDTYYFIAKSRSENSYFWRSLNMAQRPLDGPPPLPPAIPPKLDQPDPQAWSDWEKANVPISDSAIEHSIRPVWFNNRLFVVWAEYIHQEPSATRDASSASPTGTHPPLLRLSLCFKKPDGSWSTPRVCLQGYCEDTALRSKGLDAIKALVGTVAVHHQQDSHDLLYLALCVRAPQANSSNTFIFKKTTYLDKNLGVEPAGSDTSKQTPAEQYLPHSNIHRIQLKVPLQTEGEPPITGVFLGQKLRPETLPPEITSVKSSQGNTQFLDFANSALSDNDALDTPRQPIRLTTAFAPELIRRTENSLNELFDWQTQHLPEPALSGSPHNKMDFHGPYGRYFTELFLYVPWLIAHRLNTEQRYEEAERWLRHVFEPGLGDQECWRSVPLVDSNTTAYHDQAPHDPHQIALSHPVHFRKALYFLYLDILINRGDAAYRALTPDSLSEAKLWYVRALELLGPRADVQPPDQWAKISLQALSETTNDKLRDFEQSLTGSNANHSLRLRENPSQSSLPAIDTAHLRVPFNPELLKRWDMIESRLYNLRHNLDIIGKPLHLPVFAAPLDPRALPGANALNITDSAPPSLSLPYLPNYRFVTLHSQAQGAVESLSQFGATLLSLIERKEQAQLQELQQQQAWDLAKISVDLQRQALKIDRHNRQALLASRSIVEGRVNYYRHLLDKGVSETEKKACRLYLKSGASELEASDAQALAGGLMLTPNVFGLSNGGSRWEGVMHAAAAIAQGTAIGARTAATHLERTAQFHRRREEWTQAHDQARLELTQVDAQLAHFAEQETATRLQLRLAESSLGQAKANYDFFRKRFSKAQLYQWLNSQFCALYRQAYDATLALCLDAEACWQYEIADTNKRFIQPYTWNATYRGLGLGEQLKLSLLNMHAEYLRRNERELEIRKTVSLRQLKSKTATSTLNKEWAQIHADLLQGQCEFELTHELFEDDYKGQQHYLRRIKTVSVSLPALVGPYENIRATLTQTASKVFMSPGGWSVESRYANQQIALSTGLDDNGLFTLNFNDERYLPFEYTGAVSTWCLTFPNPEAQKDMLESLTDIIVQVSYTARVGGGSQ